MTVVLLVLVLAAIAAGGGLRLAREQAWRELAVFALLLLLGAVLSLAEALDLTLPTPTSLTEAVFGPLARAIAAVLK